MQRLNGLWRSSRLISGSCALLFALYAPAAAQQTNRVPQIGFLVASSISYYASRIEIFRQGLRELGYIEGKNIAVEYRFGEGKEDRLRELAAELINLKVDIIVAPASARFAKEATKTIPIVFAATADPIATGLVNSLARPGGNLTGLTIVGPELTGKRLEILKEAFPRVNRVAFVWNPSSPTDLVLSKEMEAASQAFGLKIQSLEVRNPNDLDNVFSAATREGVHALTMTVNPLLNTHRGRILEFVAKNRLPAIFAAPEIVEAGGLMSYSPDFAEQFIRLAAFVDKILKGAKPADLPVEQPKKFEFVVNLKTAKQIGLTIPPNVLTRADKVIR
jgi:putative tryptophan/tyrosine transport system substrate-binding protein